MTDGPKFVSARRWLLVSFGVALTVVLVLAGAWKLRRAADGDPNQSITSNSVSVNKPLSIDTTSNSATKQNSDIATTSQDQSHPLDPVLQLARDALEKIERDVVDYTGRLVKRERIAGKLGNEVQMDFKIRTRRETNGVVTQPLSAYLKFLEPKSARGREVIWVEGANDNKLIGHEGGLLNITSVHLEPTGLLAMMDNKYPITEIGLTRLVQKLIEKGERDRAIGLCEVQVVEDQRVGDRVCQLIQVTHPEQDPRFDFHIAQIFIDTERMIPLRYAAFLWPEKKPDGTLSEPPLEEEYTYLNVQLNVGLTDEDFSPQNAAYNYP